MTHVVGPVQTAWRNRFVGTTVGLVVIFSAAFAIRATWIHFFDPSPRDGRFDDSMWYDFSARNIAGGAGYVYFDGKPTAAWPVGYPAFVAALYKVTDERVLAPKMANAVLGGLTAVGVFFLGAAVFGRRAGWAAGGLTAFMPNQVFFSTLVMSEVLSAFLLLSALLVLVYFTLDRKRVRWPAVAVAGGLLGLLTMVRGEFLLLFLVPTLAWRVAFGQWRRALACTAVAALAMALVLTPWTVRNLVRMDYPIVVSTGAVANLLAAHWDGADGGGTFEAGNPIVEQYKHLPNPEREVVTYKAHIRKAVAWAVRHPWDELRLIPRRLYHMYRSDDSAVQWMQVKPILDKQEFDRYQTFSNGYYYMLAGWSILGAAAWWNLRDPRRLLLILVGLYFTFMFGVVFVGDPRYHFALMPVAAVLAAPAVVAVWDYLRPPTSPGRALEAGPQPVAGGPARGAP